MKKFWHQALIILATGCLMFTALVSSANANPIIKTPAWGRWASPTITYQCRSASPYYRSIWQRAIRNWNQTGAIRLTATKAGQKPDIILTSVATLSSKSGQFAGYTDYHFYRRPLANQIVYAKAMLNRQLLTHYHYTKTQRTNVATHELGHALGLGHSATGKSVMYAANRYAKISHQDKTALRGAYTGNQLA